MRIVSHEEQRHYLAGTNLLLRDVATVIFEAGLRTEEVFTIHKENVHLLHGYERGLPATASGRQGVQIDSDPTSESGICAGDEVVWRLGAVGTTTCSQRLLLV
jgi:hypothetical protein